MTTVNLLQILKVVLVFFDPAKYFCRREVMDQKKNEVVAHPYSSGDKVLFHPEEMHDYYFEEMDVHY